MRQPAVCRPLNAFAQATSGHGRAFLSCWARGCKFHRSRRPGTGTVKKTASSNPAKEQRIYPIMSSPKKDPRFIASSKDPSRAEPVSDTEYARLAAELDLVVMPLLSSAAAQLAQYGFLITKLEQRGGLASFVVRNRHPNNLRGWIYFQIHRSFGPLLSPERVFWMYSVMDANVPVSGRPGRLQDLSDVAALRDIIDGFVKLCRDTAEERSGNTSGKQSNPPAVNRRVTT